MLSAKRMQQLDKLGIKLERLQTAPLLPAETAGHDLEPATGAQEDVSIQSLRSDKENDEDIEFDDFLEADGEFDMDHNIDASLASFASNCNIGDVILTPEIQKKPKRKKSRKTTGAKKKDSRKATTPRNVAPCRSARRKQK